MVSAELVLTALMGILLVGIAIFVSRVEDWQSYTPVVGSGGGGYGTGAGAVHEEKPGGIVRWLTTVDHKDIGILYGVYATLAFIAAGLMAVLIRAQLILPSGAIIQNNGLYNAIMTNHGIIMLFLFATPAIAAFANYFVPLLVGASDMAFPRINAIAFWLLPPAGLLIVAGFFVPGIEPSQTAWTMYTPLSVEQDFAGVDLMILGLHLSGVSATMGAINFIATIFTERAEDVNWANLDIFSWTILTQSALILFAFPLLGSALVMLLLDRNVGTTFFAVGEGGGPILWQHLFWFFGHPEVYIIVLPPMGLVSLILPKFAGRKLFGFKFVVYSTLAIGVLSFGVWAHHMFTTGMDPRLRASFMAVSLAIAIPSAVKTFNWITTMWNGRIRLTTPMLFCIGFVSNFIIGGVTGVFLASIPVDEVLHDTYYVVGHFHYIVMGAITFAVYAGIYYWFPVFTGRMYQRRLGKAHFWLAMLGTNITFFAMLFLGYLGMPRRYATYQLDDALAPLDLITVMHQAASVGAFLMTIGTAIFLWNVGTSWLEGPRVGSGDPWDLKETDQHSRVFQWWERRRETAITDGGDETAIADGGSDDATSDDGDESPTHDGGDEAAPPDGSAENADDGDPAESPQSDHNSRRQESGADPDDQT